MDALRIEIGCTVSDSNLNRKQSTTATTTHPFASVPTSTSSVPPPGKRPRSHNNDVGMIPISLSAPLVPTTMGSLSLSASSASYKNTSFPLSPSLVPPPPTITTTIQIPFFVQTDDVDTNCTFNNNFKEEETIRTEERIKCRGMIPLGSIR